MNFVSRLALMNNFLHTIQQEETDAANLFIKNARSISSGDKLELARELTDLRVQLSMTQKELQETKDRVQDHWDRNKKATFFEIFLFCLFGATLILWGISYIIF